MQALHEAGKEARAMPKPEVLYLRLPRELKARLMRLAIQYDRHGSLNNYLCGRLEELAEIEEERLENEDKKRRA